MVPTTRYYLKPTVHWTGTLQDAITQKHIAEMTSPCTSSTDTSSASQTSPKAASFAKNCMFSRVDEQPCSLCLEPMALNDRVKVYPCSHFLHQDCDASMSRYNSQWKSKCFTCCSSIEEKVELIILDEKIEIPVFFAPYREYVQYFLEQIEDYARMESIAQGHSFLDDFMRVIAKTMNEAVTIGSLDASVELIHRLAVMRFSLLENAVRVLSPIQKYLVIHALVNSLPEKLIQILHREGDVLAVFKAVLRFDTEFRYLFAIEDLGFNKKSLSFLTSLKIDFMNEIKRREFHRIFSEYVKLPSTEQYRFIKNLHKAEKNTLSSCMHALTIPQKTKISVEWNIKRSEFFEKLPRSLRKITCLLLILAVIQIIIADSTPSSSEERTDL